MPRIVDSDQRRSDIARAVWRVIAADGIDAVTLRRIAAEAGVSVGRIQHYFRRKEDLLRHACRAMIDQAEALYRADDHPTDPWQRLRELVLQPVPATAAARTGVSVWQAFLTWSLEDEVMAELLRTELSGTRRALGELVAAVQEPEPSGPIRDPDAAGSALFALGHGLAQHVMAGSMTYDEAVAAADEALGWLT